MAKGGGAIRTREAPILDDKTCLECAKSYRGSDACIPGLAGEGSEAVFQEGGHGPFKGVA